MPYAAVKPTKTWNSHKKASYSVFMATNDNLFGDSNFQCLSCVCSTCVVQTKWNQATMLTKKEAGKEIVTITI